MQQWFLGKQRPQQRELDQNQGCKRKDPPLVANVVAPKVKVAVRRERRRQQKREEDECQRGRYESQEAEEAGEVIPEPVIVIDEFGNAVEVPPETDEDEESTEANDAAENLDPA